MIVTQREREAETQAEGEAGSMHREPDVGFDPGSPGSRPGPKAGAKPLRHPGIPWVSSLYVLSPFLIFPHISSPFPYIPFHYYLYSPSEWEHIMFVLLRLTYFTQHNTLQFHPRWSKWWVFVISNGWVIFHCIHSHIFFIHSSFDGHRGSFHSLAIVDIAARNIGVQVSRCFIASVSLR